MHRDEGAGADEEARARRPGRAPRRPRSAAAAAPRPSSPSGAGARAAQGAGQASRTRWRRRRARPRPRRVHSAMRGQQPGEHAPQHRADGRPAAVERRVEQARTPGRRPSRRDGAAGRRARRGPRAARPRRRGRRRATASRTAEQDVHERRRRRSRGPASRGALRSCEPDDAAAGLRQSPGDRRGSAAAGRGRAGRTPRSSSPPWASSHSRPASAIESPTPRPPAGSRVWTTTSARPEPGSPTRLTASDGGDRRASRAAPPGRRAASAPPGQACEQGDHVPTLASARAGWWAHAPEAPGISGASGRPIRRCRPLAGTGSAATPHRTRSSRPDAGGGPPARAGRRTTAAAVPAAPAAAVRRRVLPGCRRRRRRPVLLPSAAGRSGWRRAGRLLLAERPGAGWLAHCAALARPPGSAGRLRSSGSSDEDGEHQDRGRGEHAEQRPDREVAVEAVEPGEQREQPAQRGEPDGDPGPREARASGR